MERHDRLVLALTPTLASITFRRLLSSQREYSSRFAVLLTRHFFTSQLEM